MTADVMGLITRLNAQGQTFVIVTHNPEVARRCRRILFMHDGRIERDAVLSAHVPQQPLRLTAHPRLEIPKNKVLVYAKRLRMSKPIAFRADVFCADYIILPDSSMVLPAAMRMM